MNRKVKHGKRSPSGIQPLDLAGNGELASVSAASAVIVSATAFPLVRTGMVGATGFEPVTSSVSAKPQEPLCEPLFSQVGSDRRR